MRSNIFVPTSLTKRIMSSRGLYLPLLRRPVVTVTECGASCFVLRIHIIGHYTFHPNFPIHTKIISFLPDTNFNIESYIPFCNFITQRSQYHIPKRQYHLIHHRLINHATLNDSPRGGSFAPFDSSNRRRSSEYASVCSGTNERGQQPRNQSRAQLRRSGSPQK